MNAAASTIFYHARPGAARVPAWVRLVGWTAGVKIALSLGGMFSSAYTYPIPAPVFFLLAAGFGVAGGYLVMMGGHDRRTLPLGMFLLLVGSAFSRRLLAAFAQSLDPALLGLQQLPSESFLAFFLWSFVGDFPGRPVWQPRLVRWMSGASLAAGAGLAALTVADAILAGGGTRRVGVDAPIFWFVVFGLMLPAFPYALWRARGASPDERRRVRIVLLGLTLGFGPTLAAVLLSAIPAVDAFLARPDGLRWVGVVVYPPLLSIPVTMLYAVLVHRALDLRGIVRRVLQYATARYTFGILCAAPFAVVLVTVVQRRAEPVAALWSGAGGLVLAGSLALGALGLWARAPVLEALDRRFFREQYDARRILGDLVERIRSAGTPLELGRVLEERLDAALHLRSVRLLVLNPASGALVAAGAYVSPLPLQGRMARGLERAGMPVAVDWKHPAPWLARLPPREQTWLVDSDIRFLVPLRTADGSLLGVLCLGEKRSELPFTAEDTLLVSAVAGSAATWLEHRLGAHAGALHPEAAAAAVLARECTACGLVAGGTEPGSCARCGSCTRTAPLPLVVNAKYQLAERIGAGSMGVVYRAVDLALDREVAIKALPRVSPGAVLRLREEARAMAAVSHPNLALIFAAESWRGQPMLVVEHLAGGTLADRLARERCPARDAVAIVAELAPALERLHAAGILHRDIKPSNIGFAADGAPKLLDFGLARVLEEVDGDEVYASAPREAPGPAARSEAGPAAGTPLYLSPEVARGQLPDVAADLWALSLVLYEAVAGCHPFAGQPPHRVLLSVYDGVVPDVRRLVPDAPSAVAELLRELLHADRRRRPSTASALLERLQLCREGL